MESRHARRRSDMGEAMDGCQPAAVPRVNLALGRPSGRLARWRRGLGGVCGSLSTLRGGGGPAITTARAVLPLVVLVALGGCSAGGSDLGEPPIDSGVLSTAEDSGRRADGASPLSLTDAGDRDASAGQPDGSVPAPGALRECVDLVADLPAPQTIEQAVDRINRLPRPVTIGCFVASLPRPLEVVATESIFSAQPANGRQSPRIFLMGDGLILSVVPDGEGAELLEFGQFVSTTRTLKGELVFPVSAHLSYAAPYERVVHDATRTTCAVCHRGERPAVGLPGAFVSEAIRPAPLGEVSVQQLEAFAAACEPGEQAGRCGMLDALFGYGPVLQGAFDDAIPLLR